MQIHFVPPDHQLTVVTNPDGTRDLAIVFVGDGSDPHVARVVIPDLDSLLHAPCKHEPSLDEPQTIEEWELGERIAAIHGSY